MTKASGKKQNALKHGVYSREMMLPGESESQYRALRAALHEEYQPDGVSEEFLVDELCSLMWKKRRLESFNREVLYQRVVEAHIDNEANRRAKIVRDLAPKFSEATSVDAVEQIFSSLGQVDAEVIASWVPLEKCKDPTQWGPAIAKFLLDLKLKVLQVPGLFVTIVNPDLMDLELSRSLRLDEAIDRSIKRILQVKMAKQIFPNTKKKALQEPRLVNALIDADKRFPMIIEDEQLSTTLVDINKVTESNLDEEPLLSKYDASIEASRIAERSASSLRAVVEKEQTDADRVKVEFLAKQTPVDLMEMQEFSNLCNELRERRGVSEGIGLIARLARRI